MGIFHRVGFPFGAIRAIASVVNGAILNTFARHEDAE
jgi:hypothetical protein